MTTLDDLSKAPLDDYSYELLQTEICLRAMVKFPWHEQLLKTTAWSIILNKKHGLRSFTVACSAKWAIKDDYEIGEAMLEGKRVGAYYGYAATEEEEREATRKGLYPEQFHYCVGMDLGNFGSGESFNLDNLGIFDPWSREVMEDYELATGKAWNPSLVLPPYIIGTVKSLRALDYHYNVNTVWSAVISGQLMQCSAHLSKFKQP